VVVDPALTLGRLHAAQQEFYAGGGDGPLREVLCPDIAWHVPGASDIAGTYVGVDEVLAYFARRRDLAGRTFRMRPAELLSGDGEHVAMITHGQATIAGRRHAWSTVGLYRLRADCVAECRLLAFDQAEFDRIWTRRPDLAPLGHSDPAVYDRIGSGYTRHRRPDRRIAAAIHASLGDARTVVNVGAGAGAYEPTDRCVVAVEPSQAMIAQRPPGSAPVIVGAAAALPLADATVDAAMATLSLHHWPDWRTGVAEMLRVARRRIVVFTSDKRFDRFWLSGEYLDWLADWDAERFPTMDELLAELPNPTVTAVPIPRDCTDGFLAAYYARPEAYLDPAVRQAMSIFALAPDPDRVAASMRALEDDLRSGDWDARHGSLRHTASIDAGYRLVASEL
jgi:SAM-dependent methyltransferase/ketosteroid isomerase-like protein